MCTLAILYRVARNTPILLAANREESFSRPTQYPKIQPGVPRVVCGIDRQAGGTWLGVNQFGLLVLVTNRPKVWRRWSRGRAGCCAATCWIGATPATPSSRPSGSFPAGRMRGPIIFARRPLCGRGLRRQSRRSGGIDARVAHADQRRPGRSQRRASPVPPPHVDAAHVGLGGDVSGRCQPGVLAEAERGRPPRRGPDRRRLWHGFFDAVGLSRKAQHSTYQYSPGPPSETAYDNLSALLRQVLSAGRGRKPAVHNGEKPPLAKSKVKAKASPRRVH